MYKYKNKSLQNYLLYLYGFKTKSIINACFCVIILFDYIDVYLHNYYDTCIFIDMLSICI